MLITSRSSVASASRVDDNEVVGGGCAIGGGAIGRGAVGGGAVGGGTIGGGAIGEDAVGWSDASRKLAKSKSRTKSGHLVNSNNLEEPKFLTFKAKEAFNCLKQAFTKAPILRHFDPECHIWIETDVSGYAIRGVLS